MFQALESLDRTWIYRSQNTCLEVRQRVISGLECYISLVVTPIIFTEKRKRLNNPLNPVSHTVRLARLYFWEDYYSHVLPKTSFKRFLIYAVQKKKKNKIKSCQADIPVVLISDNMALHSRKYSGIIQYVNKKDTITGWLFSEIKLQSCVNNTMISKKIVLSLCRVVMIDIFVLIRWHKLKWKSQE